MVGLASTFEVRVRVRARVRVRVRVKVRASVSVRVGVRVRVRVTTFHCPGLCNISILDCLPAPSTRDPMGGVRVSLGVSVG